MARLVYREGCAAPSVAPEMQPRDLASDALAEIGISLADWPANWFEGSFDDLHRRAERMSSAGAHDMAGRFLRRMREQLNQLDKAMMPQVIKGWLVLCDVPESFQHDPACPVVLDLARVNDAQFFVEVVLWLQQPEIAGCILDGNNLHPKLIEFVAEACMDFGKRLCLGRPQDGASLYEQAKSHAMQQLPMQSFKAASRAFPDEVYIIPAIANCNLACRMCMLSVKKVIEKALMPKELFERAIASIPPEAAIRLALTPFTEPLALPNFIDYVEYAVRERPKARVTINSNCTLLTEEASRQLVASGLSGIILSLNVHTPEDFAWFTGKDLFAMATENIRTLRRVRDEAGSSTPEMVLQLINMPRNAPHAEEFVATWSPVVDRIVFSLLDDNGGVVDVDEQVREGIDLPNSVKDVSVCMAPWSTLTVNWDGDIFGCCPGGFLDLKGSPAHLGNIANVSLAEAWESRALRELRSSQLLNNNETCAHCRYKGRSAKDSMMADEAIMRVCGD